MKRSLIALFGGLIASGLIGAQFGTHVYSLWKEGGWQGLDRLGCAAIPLVASGETAFIPVENWPEETPLTKEMVVILHGNTTDKNFGAITVESDEKLFNRLGKQTPDSELDPWEDGWNPVGTERTYYDSVESTEGWYASWPTEVWPGCTNYEDGRDHKPVANRWWIEIPIKADVDGRKLFFSVGITGQELTSKAIYLVSDSKELLEAGNFVREFGSNAKFAIKNRGITRFRAADYVPIRPSDYTRDWWWFGPKYQYNNSRSYIGRVIDANYQANLNARDNRKGVPYTAFEMSIKTDYNEQIVGSKTAFVAPEAGRLVLALCDDDQFFQLQNGKLQPFASTTVAKASTSAQRRFWFYNAINEGKLYEVDLKAGETAVFSYPYEKEYDENNASLYIGRLAFFPEAVRSISVTGSWSTLRYQNGQPFPYSPGVVFGGGVYREGEPITLTAISYPGHEFDRWEVVYLGKRSGQMSIPEAITNAINTANESHAPTLTLPEVESIYGSASDEAAIVVRAHWKNVQIAQVRTDPLDVAKYKGGRPTGNGLVIDGHEQTFSAPESVATGSKDGKVYAFTHWEQPVSKAASNILLAASDSPSSEATFSTTVAINATTPITTYVAHYAAGYPIKSAVLPAKSGSIAGPQASAVGSEVTYTASPAQYYRFVHWSNSVTKEILSTEETYTFTMPDAQVSLTATFEKIPVEVKLEVPGGSALGTASGGKETLAGTKLTLKATPAKDTVFAGWYFDEDFTVPAAFPNAIDYRTASISFTPTGERPIETFYARFVPTEEDQSIVIHPPQLIYTAGETVDETLSLRSCSLPKVSVKGLPSGMKFDANTLKLSGAPTKPGFYEVAFEATNASVKKATENTRRTVTMKVKNFTDTLLPIADSYGDGDTIIPGVAQSLDLGEEAIGWSAAGLPAGMKWDAKTGTLMGTPNKPGRYTIIFTKKVGKETHTVSTTFMVAPFPQLTIQAVLHDGSSDDVPFGTVSGAGEYAANTGVKLMAKPAKGFVFSGWSDEFGAPLPGLTVDYRTASVTWPMADSDTTIYASFVPTEEDQSIFIYSPQLIYPAGETVDETLSLSSYSLPKVSVKGLPSGMKFDAKTFKLSGAPTKPGFYEVTFEATNASVKKATGDTRRTVTMEVKNFTDPLLLPIADSYGDGNTIIPGVAQSIDLGEKAIGWSAAGLPAGMKWDAKTGTLMGAPNKPGRYTIIFTKKVGKETHTVSTTFIVTPFPKLTIQAVQSGEASDDVPFGTVSGAGEYAANKGVKLIAKPAKGFVFSGWFDKDGAPLPGLTVDYRTASVTWPMANSDTTIYARFVPTEEDAASINEGSFRLDGELDGTLTINPAQDAEIKIVEHSNSLPKVAFKGLPAGLKYNAKTNIITGKATKPGIYTVTMSLANASVPRPTASTTQTVSCVVLNFDELGIGDVATPVEILAGTTEHNDSRFAQLSGASVAGLPRGLKWDTKNGTLSGATSTLGNYTVTFTRNKLRTSLTFVVSAQPMAVAMVTPEANQNLLGSASTSRAPSAGTYSLAGTLIGDWAEAVEGDTLSGTITLEANGNAHATLLLGAEADPFSLTGGVENDGSILLFGVCPADFVKPGALIEVLIDNQEVYFTTGDLNGYGLLTEGPFSLTPVSK